MTATSRIEIDLAAIEHNVGVVRSVLRRSAASRAVPEPWIGAVMKADGYGLGAPRIAKRLGACGVNMLMVYTPEQARALVEANISLPILMLMPVRELDRGDALYRSAARDRLHFTVHDAEGLASIISMADWFGMTLPLHLEVDTGMSRGGTGPTEALSLARTIAEHPRLRLAGVSSHMASAHCDGEFTAQQHAAFSRWLAQAAAWLPPDCLVHEANTFAVFRSGGAHRGMVRVGLGLLGYAGEEFTRREEFEFEGESRELQPAVRWISRVVHVKSIRAGTPVGYGSAWRAARDSRIALVPVGYADGYPIALSNKGTVAVELPGGIRAYVPVIGRVSMDQITIDITDIPAEQAGIGSCVEVVGNDRTAANHLPALAAQAGTITHELLCRLSPRLPRTYIAVENPKMSPGQTEAPIVTRAAV